MCVLNTHISQLATALKFQAGRQAYICCLVFMQSVSACRERRRSMSQPGVLDQFRLRQHSYSKIICLLLCFLSILASHGCF